MRGSFRSFEETSGLKSRDSAFDRFTMQQQNGPTQRTGLGHQLCGSSAAAREGRPMRRPLVREAGKYFLRKKRFNVHEFKFCAFID
jgi:hypothetical protein